MTVVDTGRVGAVTSLRDVTDAGSGPTHGAAGAHLIRRARLGVARAALGDVTRASGVPTRRGRREHGILGASTAHAVTALLRVARADRRTTRYASGLYGVRWARGGDTIALLFDVAYAARCAARDALCHDLVRRAAEADAVASIRQVARPRGRPTNLTDERGRIARAVGRVAWAQLDAITRRCRRAALGRRVSEGVQRTCLRRAIACLGQVAWPRARSTRCADRRDRIVRTRRAEAGTGLGDVAHIRRDTARRAHGHVHGGACRHRAVAHVRRVANPWARGRAHGAAREPIHGAGRARARARLCDITRHNEALSRARADSVIEALVLAGVPRSRLMLRGAGSRCASSDVPDSQNRRVEILIVR